MDAFQGDVKFSMKVRLPNKVETTVNFDLAEMGATPRTMNNVVKYLNDKLGSTGFRTRFAVEKISGADKTTEVNGPDGEARRRADKFALKIQGDTTEILTFSAPTTAPAVYITQPAGDPNPPKTTTYTPVKKTDDADTATTKTDDKPLVVEELIKFETGTTSDAVRRRATSTGSRAGCSTSPCRTGWRRFAPQVTGPDGAVYMLADVNAPVDGQDDQGPGDVALMKFDSAGKLVYTRTLGASADASRAWP